MRLLRTAAVLLFLLPCLLPKAQSLFESTNEDSVHYLKLINGANAVLRPLPAAANTEIAIHIMAGGLFENDSMNGVAQVTERIIASKINNFLRGNTGTLNLQNTSFHAYSTSERTVFKLTVPGDSIAAALNVFIKYVFTSPIDETEVSASRDSLVQETAPDRQNPRKIFHDKLLKSVFRREFEIMNGGGSADELNKIDLSSVIRFYKRHYVVNNSILIASGNFNYPYFRLEFETLFKPLKKSDFDPEGITKITDFRPMVYTSQFVVEDSTAVPEFHICWQFPGSSSNRVASYNAALLTTMLNDKNNFIQVKAAKMGCKKLVAQYEVSNYSGILRVILQSDTNLIAVYQFVMAELLRLEKTLVNESMMNAGKLQFRRDYSNAKRTKEFAEKIVSHWSYKDDSYFRVVSDSLLGVRENKLRSFVIEYMNLSPHVTGLLISKADRERLKLDSVFNDVDENVGNYTFRYLQNITDLEGTENLIMQQNLLQWLLINKDVNVQINGFSDKGEFNKVKDRVVKDFIDSIPTFRKIVPQLIEKGYLRTEMMRAIKIVKYLYLNGISADRLTGTAMTFSSTNDEEAIENAKCTVTLEKLHKSMPLREFYYGNQKE